MLFPTVHLVGCTEDSAARRLAEVAKELCNPSERVFILHDGGHEVPQKKETADAVARAIEKAFFYGQGSW